MDGRNRFLTGTGKLCRALVLVLVLLLAGTAFVVINSVTPPGYLFFLLLGRVGALAGVAWRNRVGLAYVAIILFVAHEVEAAVAYLVIASPRFHDFFADLDASVIQPLRRAWRRRRFCLRVRLKCRRAWRRLVERLLPPTATPVRVAPVGIGPAESSHGAAVPSLRATAQAVPEQPAEAGRAAAGS